jgi:Icc-related predicted phosphoesterase
MLSKRSQMLTNAENNVHKCSQMLRTMFTNAEKTSIAVVAVPGNDAFFKFSDVLMQSQVRCDEASCVRRSLIEFTTD